MEVASEWAYSDCWSVKVLETPPPLPPALLLEIFEPPLRLIVVVMPTDEMPPPLPLA